MNGPRQLALPLPVRKLAGREDFFISASNQAALARIDGWKSWADARLLLVGGPGTGKSHLAAIWADMAGASMLDCPSEAPPTSGPLVIENVDQLDGPGQEALFHLYNRMGGQTPLLMTGTGRPGGWSLALPDLHSRLLSVGLAEIHPPDDALIAAMLVKLFNDRQLIVTEEVITHLPNHVDRDAGTLARVVEMLDAASLAEGKAISWRFVRRVLGLNKREEG